ncbi:hypothetical protein AN0215.2 [Aspergillus nidulans FGSC A4]|uniref:TauD/TfdA-like domain-containing protein n=1 Tax=Emericella nidulans (strain FGSC A4 / ATCC 38163 / CBS 112.46 / NRRL 194 / M139) TaxID=227321 RepID=Q5BGW5_EMENI|nr:hypothetical protein [Aspergillus nidulans FGSC A4]EAA66088.1 hypothetical protein AN0215.2 [Aspergillus nidulans FGSC A4]CBF89959.1 TPA: conserved hypothetical protein [Aspergillus nidulans FGSC A4]|eukprot:XP_657819.1 hypothetical protein AN0215.2 [Aspergillus nidulans FGSC A4]
MAHLQARQHISPDSGFPVTLHPLFNPGISSHVPPEPIRDEITPPPDRASFADPEKRALFSPGVKRINLTESIGTVLEGVQISQLSASGLKFVNIHGSREDHREILKYTPWPSGDFHADTSFEINRALPATYAPKYLRFADTKGTAPSYSLLRMEEHPEVGGDTAWARKVSQYGLYDALSDAYKKFLDGLHAVHTSRLQYDTILDLWGTGPNRPPIDTHHPAVRTHPVTGLKALNVNPGFVTGFAELKKAESDKVLDFLAYHIHSADDHYVRWKWAVGSVAMWDNRCTLHRVIPGTYEGKRRGIRTTVFGEKPYFDPASESRNERNAREKREKEEKEREKDKGDGVLPVETPV